jgi:alpha-1,2-mannosyltransferase
MFGFGKQPSVRNDAEHVASSTHYHLPSTLLFYWPYLFLVICFAGMTGQMICNIFPSMHIGGDYDVHREFGRRFLVGQSLTADNICFNYMPISAMYYAPLALMDPYVGPFVRYLVAVICLAVSFVMLDRMVRPYCRPLRWKAATVIALTVLLASHYLMRDMTDGGPHTILLAMLVGGIYCAWRGRDKLAAVWLGLAIALKMTPGLLVPFFLWKRRWRLAIYTTLATIGWIALPAVWMGPRVWWHDQQQWNHVALSVFADKSNAARDECEVHIQNQSLKPAVLRWLVTYPPGHPLKVNHWADVGLCNLRPAAANRLANLAVLAALAAFAWSSRRTYRDPHDPAFLRETSIVLVLMLLLSPITWLQHMVFLLPALYLIVVQDQTVRKMPRAAAVALWLYVAFSLLLNRGLLGTQNYFVLLSYHTHTLCAILVWVMVAVMRPLEMSGVTIRSGLAGSLHRATSAAAA